MASMLNKARIKHLKSIVWQLKNKNYNIYGDNGDYKNDDVSNNNNNNSNSNTITLWSNTTHSAFIATTITRIRWWRQ